MDHRTRGGRHTRLAEVSQGLWGNQDRLPVAAAVGETDPADLYAQKLAALVGIPENRISLQLRMFVNLGLLVRLPKAGGERRVYYQRTNQPFWNAVGKMAQALRD